MWLQSVFESSIYWSQTGQASEGAQIPDGQRRRASLASTSCIRHRPPSLPLSIHPHPFLWAAQADLCALCVREQHFWQGDCGDADPSRAERPRASVTPAAHIEQRVGHPMRQWDKITPTCSLPPSSFSLLPLATEHASLCDTGTPYALLKTLFLKRLLAHYSATTVTCLDAQNVHFSSEECAHPGSSLKLTVLWKGWNSHTV